MGAAMLTGSGLSGGGVTGGTGDVGPKGRSRLKNPLTYTSLAILVALVYVGWIFFLRWQGARDMAYQEKQREAQEKAKRAEDDQKTVESLGGNQFEILAFYAPGIIRRGDSGDLCYGVSNAKTVKIEPPVGGVWPSLSRCIPISPKTTTTYTLTADDGQGNTKTESLTVEVR